MAKNSIAAGPRLIIKRAKTVTIPGKRKAVILEDAWSYIVWDISKDLHLSEGILKKSDLEKPDGAIIKSSLGGEFVIISPSFADLFAKITKGPQTIPLKDLSLIAAKTGINKDSIVFDVGGGSGAAACFLSRQVSKVFCFELLDTHCAIIKENAQKFKISNIEVIQRNAIDDKFKEGSADLVLIDLPTPWLLVPKLKDLVKIGGYVVNYSPPIISTYKFCDAMAKFPAFQVQETFELIDRPWKVEGEAVRPATTKIGHSGFVTIARRLSK